MAGTDSSLPDVAHRLSDAAHQAQLAAQAHQKLIADGLDTGSRCASAAGVPGSHLIISGIHHLLGKPNQSQGDDAEACVRSIADTAKTVGPPLKKKAVDVAHSAASAAAPLAHRISDEAKKLKDKADSALHPKQ